MSLCVEGRDAVGVGLHPSLHRPRRDWWVNFGLLEVMGERRGGRMRGIGVCGLRRRRGSLGIFELGLICGGF